MLEGTNGSSYCCQLHQKHSNKNQKQCQDNHIIKHLREILVNDCHNEIPYFHKKLTEGGFNPFIQISNNDIKVD